MSRPISPAEVEAEILRLSERMSDMTLELPTMARDAAEADVRYKAAHARAILKAQGSTVSDREAEAMLACEDERMTAKVADKLYDAQVEALRSIRSQLDALRSINANLRVQV